MIFKVGQKVKCIDNKDTIVNLNLQLNKIYTIKNISDDFFIDIGIYSKGNLYLLDANRFELV